MREIRSPGSVRGVPGNRHSYRDKVERSSCRSSSDFSFVAVGMPVTRHPRTDPGERISRTGLLPQVVTRSPFCRMHCYALCRSGVRLQEFAVVCFCGFPCCALVRLSIPFP